MKPITDSEKAAAEIYQFLRGDEYASLLENSCWQDGHPEKCGHVFTQPYSPAEADALAVARIRQIIDKHLC